MKKLRYYFTIKYTIVGLSIGLFLITTGIIFNYSHGFNGTFLQMLEHFPDFIILLLSPLIISLFFGFVGFKSERSVQLNRSVKDLLFKEHANHWATGNQLKFLAKAMEQVNESIVICDSKGRVQWLNEGFTKINGYTLKEIEGKELDKILHGPLTDAVVANRIIVKLQNGEAVAEELLTYHKNGNTLWLYLSIKPIFIKNGKLEKFIAIQKNITERKKKQFAIEALYREVADYKLALDQSAIVIRFNAEGKIIYVNDKFCEINELSKEGLVGKSYRSINISIRDKKVMKPVWDSLKIGKTWKGELINRNKGGKTYWADTTIVPLLDTDGKPYQFLAIQQNITERKELENQLIANKNQLQEAMRIAKLGSWEMDANGKLTFSEELRDLYKLPPEQEAKRDMVFNNIHPDDKAYVREKLDWARNILKTTNIEYRYLINGDVHYMSATHTPKLNEAGEYIGSLGTVQDITSSKLSELALIKSEEEKEIVLNNTQTIICLHDMSGKIIYINASAEKMSGYRKEEIIGFNLKMLVSPENHKKFDEYIDTINNNRSASGMMQIISKSGSKRVWLYQNVVYANNGNKPYVIASAVDITTSVKAQNEIERQQQFIRQLIDNSPNLIFVLNEEKKVILANEKFASFYKYELNTTPLAVDLSTGPNDIFLGDVDSVFEMEDGEMIRWEGSQAELADDKIAWFTVINKCFKERSGKKYVLVYGMDITGRHKTETELLEANELVRKSLRVKDQFISNMSHEIRTPLNAVIGFNDLLAETTLNKEQAEYVDIVKTASSNLLSLINNILDLSKIESKSLDLENLPVDINKVIKDVVKILESKANNKGLELNYTIDCGGQFMVVGDQLRLAQVMFNLLSNAIKFTDEGCIDIACKRTNGEDETKDYIAFSIKDTGIGVPKDKQAEIFERFTQANTNTQRLYGGTGLGLNITKSIIDLYGGNITIESTPDVGTTFSFIIPFNKYKRPVEVANNKSGRVEDIQSQYTRKPLHILLAEDNSVNAMLATVLLTRKGFTIEHVVNGELALEAVQKKYYDLILMDIQMPVMNGIQSSKAIRKLDNNVSSIPIIAMTAHSLQGEMQNCFDSGMNGYIAKPFKPDDLFETIYDVMRNAYKINVPCLTQSNVTDTIIQK